MHISELGEMLASDDQSVRHRAAELLSQNTEAAADVSPALVKHAGDDDRVVAEYCVATLEELGMPPASQLGALAKLAASDNVDVAYWAITLIGRSGVAAAEHAKLLGDIVASKAAPQVRERAAWALTRIGPPAAVAQPQLESCQNVEPKSLALAIAKALDAVKG